MDRPAIVVVDEDPDALTTVAEELHDRYTCHYDVACVSSASEARAILEARASEDGQVALVMASPRLEGTTGGELLDSVRRSHPRARRALLIPWGAWGERSTGETIFEGISDGSFEHYVLQPGKSPDELFHHTVAGLLLDWAEAHREAPFTVHVVGESWSGRAYELRSVLQHCAIAHRFCLADSPEGRSFLEAAGDEAELPLIVFPNGDMLKNPTDREIALAAGSPVDPDRLEFDVVIVGAGPAGLSAAVYGASEGFGTLVIDRGGIGGQATSSSLIRNYLGFPRGISGRQLAQSAYSQAWVFGSDFAFMQRVAGLEREGDHLVVTLYDGMPIRTTAVLLATGASYRRLGVPSIEELTGSGVYYGGTISEAPATTGQDVFVVGGANSAGQSALHLSRYAKRVTIVVRAGSLHAGMSDYLVREIEATDNIDVRVGTEVIDGGGEGKLEHLVLQDRSTGERCTVDADALFLLIGAQPNTDWLPPDVALDAQGFVLTGTDTEGSGRWPLDRSPMLLETSMPGVFAAGDVRHGGVKRVASAVGEGSIAVQLLHGYFSMLGREPKGRPEPGPDQVAAADAVANAS